jgi:hypothetical protein
MIWLTWRQHRKQVMFTGLALAVLAALILPTGLAMRATYEDKGLADCSWVEPVSSTCNTAINQFTNQYESFTLIGILFLVLPLLVGLFWGAPLVAREVEQGTHRLVWTQGISRRRWALVKLGLVGAVTVVLAVGYGLGMTWWWAPLSETGQFTRFEWLLFDMQGVVPIGYTAFAVALGVFGGTVWHRMLPAMGLTLGGFLAVRIALAALGRPRYVAAETRETPVEGFRGGRGEQVGEWTLATGVRNPDGTLVAADAQVGCPPGVEGPGGRRCGAELGLEPGAYNWRLYQPADRFWLFQWIETGIFVALALLLFYLAIRRIRRIA